MCVCVYVFVGGRVWVGMGASEYQNISTVKSCI